MQFGTLDFAVILTYLAVTVLFGLHFRKRQQSLNEYFQGSRKIPWLTIGLSIVATETSVLTVVGMPGLAYATDMLFFQLILGNLVGRILTCIIFIPKYYSGNFLTAYQFIASRFGRRVQQATAGLFVLTRAPSEGVRVFAAAIVISLILETNVFTALVILVLLTLLYTVVGGLTAVIWNDAFQLLLYLSGGILAFYYILSDIPGGWIGMVQTAGDKLEFFDFSLDPLKPYTFWSGMVAGIFQTLASQGVDQLLVQRLLAARNKKESQFAVLAAAFIFTLQYFFFLLLGVALFVFFQQHPPTTPFELTDQVFPFFVVNHLPSGLAGLVIAGMIAAAMSTTSSSLNSMASASVVDLYPNAERLSRERQLLLSRGLTVFWAIALVGFAMLARNWGNVVEAATEVISITYGGMLGIFLLGILTRIRSQAAPLIGMAVGLLTVLSVKFLTPIPYTWYFAIGTITTFGVGWASALILELGGRMASSADP